MATDSPRVSTPRCRPLRQSTNNIRLRPAVDDMSVICQPSNDKPSIDKLARCSGRLSVTHRSIQVGQCSTDTRPLPGCYIDRQSTEVSTALSVDTPYKSHDPNIDNHPSEIFRYTTSWDRNGKALKMLGQLMHLYIYV